MWSFSLMKKYFTKYLPVGEEIDPYDIKIDERFFDHSISENKIGTRMAGGWFTVDDDQGKCNFPLSEKVQRVKLFLCSRDIQDTDIGTKIHGIREGGWGSYHEGTFVRRFEKNPYYVFVKEENGDEYMLCRYWKKIGEVSPNAIWIKEGKEFEEKDFAIQDSWGRVYPDGIEFKCFNCNTFH